MPEDEIAAEDAPKTLFAERVFEKTLKGHGGQIVIHRMAGGFRAAYDIQNGPAASRVTLRETLHRLAEMINEQYDVVRDA